MLGAWFGYIAESEIPSATITSISKMLNVFIKRLKSTPTPPARRTKSPLAGRQEECYNTSEI